jgi:hypothetical protein
MQDPKKKRPRRRSYRAWMVTKQRSSAYEDTPEQVKNREARNRARYAMEKAGKVHKGDGRDVDHVRPLAKGGSTSTSNLRVISVHRNRGYPRDARNKPTGSA